MIENVAVLMTVHNRKNVTRNCLEHLFQSAELFKDKLSIDVFLVDDGSTDGTKEMVQGEFPKVKVIDGDGNLFWNRGMRLAWQNAEKGDYDFYLWLNDDTVIYENTLLQMLEAYSDNVNSVIVGATHSTEDMNRTTYGGYDSNDNLISPNGTYQKLSMINGNFVLISRSVFKVCGLLPAQLHHTGGDNYYAIKSRKCGISCILMKDYVGICDQHDKPTPFTDPNVPLIKRLKSLYYPDNLFTHAWVLNRMDKGIWGVIVNVTSLHVYALFPSFVRLVRKIKIK